MLGKFIRWLLWQRRIHNAELDIAYYRSGVSYYSVELRKAKDRLARLEREANDVRFPLPSAVVRGRS